MNQHATSQSGFEDTNPEEVEGSEPKYPESLHTLQEVRKALKYSYKDGDGPMEVADVKILDPERAFANLEAALKLTKKHFPISDIYFKQFPGNIVGESTTQGAVIDPIMLMHPAHRLAHVLAHELSHAKTKVLSEAVAENYAEVLGFTGEEDGLKVTEKYNEACTNYSEFLTRISHGGDTDFMSKKIYNLYYRGQYESIFNLYDRFYISTRKEENEQLAAFMFFQKVFPELDLSEYSQRFHHKVANMEK